MLKDAKAISYKMMKNYKDGFDYDTCIFENTHDDIWIISVTDPDVSPLFSNNDKVLVLQFDDVDPEYDKNLYKDLSDDDQQIDQIVTEILYKNAFTPQQAKQVVEFIMKANSASDTNSDGLLVNCMAGVSRSGAITTFARQICGMSYDKFKAMNPQIVPNSYVLKLLHEEYMSLDQDTDDNG